MRVGVLASQGGFGAHRTMLEALGAVAVEVRQREDLEGVDALVLPGGESTTIARAIERDGLEEPIERLVRGGTPVLATCAGLILLGREHLGLLDVSCRRNAFGRQLRSFEADLEIEGLGPEALRAIFIRAPWVEEWGEGVEVLASHEGRPVCVREGNVVAAAFHPELTDDPRLHALALSPIDNMARPASTAPTTATAEEDET